MLQVTHKGRTGSAMPHQWPSCYGGGARRQALTALSLSSVVAGQFRSNDAGRTVQSVWSELTVLHPGVDTDGVVIMPNMFTALCAP